MTFVVVDRGNARVVAPRHPSAIHAYLTVDDDVDGLSVCSFVGDRTWCLPVARRIADLLNLFGLVDETELLTHHEGEIP